MALQFRRIRHHQFGEGGYDECERGIQQLLREAGSDFVGDDLVSVVPEGFEVQADWTNLRSPETYSATRRARTLPHLATPRSAGPAPMSCRIR